MSENCVQCGRLVPENRIVRDEEYSYPFCPKCMEIRGYSSTLEIRKTHKYVGEWQHLDDWETVGYYNTLAVSEVVNHAECSLDDTLTTYHILKVKRLTTAKITEKALHDTFTKRGCSCEHDCCGCPSTYTTKVKNLGDGEWLVVTTTYYNIG